MRKDGWPLRAAEDAVDDVVAVELLPLVHGLAAAPAEVAVAVEGHEPLLVRDMKRAKSALCGGARPARHCLLPVARVVFMPGADGGVCVAFAVEVEQAAPAGGRHLERGLCGFPVGLDGGVGKRSTDGLADPSRLPGVSCGEHAEHVCHSGEVACPDGVSDACSQVVSGDRHRVHSPPAQWRTGCSIHGVMPAATSGWAAGWCR